MEFIQRSSVSYMYLVFLLAKKEEKNNNTECLTLLYVSQIRRHSCELIYLNNRNIRDIHIYDAETPTRACTENLHLYPLMFE